MVFTSIAFSKSLDIPVPTEILLWIRTNLSQLCRLQKNWLYSVLVITLYYRERKIKVSGKEGVGKNLGSLAFRWGGAEEIAASSLWRSTSHGSGLVRKTALAMLAMTSLHTHDPTCRYKILRPWLMAKAFGSGLIWSWREKWNNARAASLKKKTVDRPSQLAAAENYPWCCWITIPQLREANVATTPVFPNQTGILQSRIPHHQTCKPESITQTGRSPS